MLNNYFTKDLIFNEILIMETINIAQPAEMLVMTAVKLSSESGSV